MGSSPDSGHKSKSVVYIVCESKTGSVPGTLLRHHQKMNMVTVGGASWLELTWLCLAVRRMWNYFLVCP